MGYKVIATILALAMTDLTRSAEAFLCPNGYSAASIGNPVPIIHTQQQASSDDNNNNNSGASGEKQPDPVEAFMESASQKGADKVRDMSIEERTRRAMLAEAMEDRIFSMYDDIETLLEDGLPKSSEDRDEIQSLAKEIKASQSQYEDIVSGEPSAMLGTLNDVASNSSDTTSKRNEPRKDNEDL